MVEIEIPDAEELGGNVTKPFKFVTGEIRPSYGHRLAIFEDDVLTLSSDYSWSVYPSAPTRSASISSACPPNQIFPCRVRRSLPEPEPDKTLLAELCRLPQMHSSQGRRVQAVSTGEPAVVVVFDSLDAYIEVFVAKRRWNAEKGAYFTTSKQLGRIFA